MANFFVIAGPCVIESEEHAMKMCEEIKKVTDKAGVDLIFKASFDKANRTSIHSYRGPGLNEGLRILKKVKDTYGVRILTDVHEPWQCNKVAEVADVLQTPAFLMRQTDLLVAAAKTGKIVNVKKFQVANSVAVKHAYEKLIEAGAKEVWLCDRGNMLGTDDMVVDFRNLVLMRENKGSKVVMDITHSLQMPNRAGVTLGMRNLIPTIGRCAIATGVDGIFMEVHNNPKDAKSDSATQFPLKHFEQLLTELVAISKVTNGKEKWNVDDY